MNYSIEEWEANWETLPCNGMEGQPCPNGCIMIRNRKTGLLSLSGDCRAPYNENCALNKQDEELERR